MVNEYKESQWTAVALLYGSPPKTLGLNSFAIKQKMAAFREALVGQWPIVADMDDRQLLRVHYEYTKWYVLQRWKEASRAPND